MEYPMAPMTENSGVSGAVGFGFGVLCGAALGAAIAMLWAPKSGVELRRDVAKSMDKMKRQATSSVSNVAERGRRAWEAGREAFNEAAEAANDAATGEGFVR